MNAPQCDPTLAHPPQEEGDVNKTDTNRPKPPYLLIDSRRLDAGNIFVPVKENSELSLACVSEGGNPKPVLTWEILLSPGVDRHAQKVTAELTQLQEVKNDKENSELSLACVSEGGNPKPVLTWEILLSPGVDRHAQKVTAELTQLQEVKNDKDREPYRINSGAISEAKLPTVYRAHHNARILYTPSFAISRTPGFGYPLREGIEVSLKCDVDSNPPSTPVWQKDDGDTPVPQPGDGFLNFTSIRREHSGWYKCTSRHLNFQYSSIGYYLSVRCKYIMHLSMLFSPSSHSSQ
uniref:Ig-like domain-containing protein n=1 Tax=Lutzomyia longipalpis TaxID=7200 RepID=A0A1B0CH15_LUTLO